MTRREKIRIAAAMNTLNEVAESLKPIDGLFEVRCLLDDEVVVRLREHLLAGVEAEWLAAATSQKERQ